MLIANRTFIISGGSSGLGLATASTIIANGGYASILDINPPPTSETDDTSSTTLKASHVLFTKTDVSSTLSLTAAVSATIDWTKTTSAPLSGVICCAGIGAASAALPRQPSSATSTSSPSELAFYSIEHFDKVISINLRGTVDLIRLCLPYISLNEPWGDDGERGVVVVVSSVAAYEGQVGQLAYSASKGAVASLVLPLAREVGAKAGIRVMGVAPGVFETGMTTRPGAKKGAEGKAKSTANMAGVNREMVQYPTRMGQAHEFGRLVKEIVENSMLNGFVIRLDGAVRMPSRL